ncbi:MAG: hypothetical protein GF311_16620 [Candidatus Lokiarchaeota archaeon]|nr:hypothetical protein [Candidatus Lokiarchaeota archaeon]
MYGLYIDTDRNYIYACGQSIFLIFPLNGSNLPETPTTLALGFNGMCVEKISNSRLAIGGNNLYVSFVDISNLNNLSLIGSVILGEIVYALYYTEESGTELFAAGDDIGLMIIDFSSYTNPLYLGSMGSTTSIPDGWGIDKKEDYILLAGGSRGVFIYNYDDCLSLSRPDLEISGYTIALILVSLIGICLLMVRRIKKY